MLNDLRYALRMLRKNPGFTAVAVLTLALGIGGTTAIFSVVHGALINPFPYRDMHRLAVLVARSAAGTYAEMVSAREWLDYQQQNHVFEEVMGDRATFILLTGSGAAQYCWGHWVTTNTFRVLDARPLLGRVFTDEDGKPGAPPVVILSYKTWQSKFGGDPGIIGKTLILDHQATTVIGVMPLGFGRIPHSTGLSLALWLPKTISRGHAADPYTALPYYNLAGRLKPGISIEQAASEMAVLGKRFATAYPRDHPKDVTYTVEPFTKAFTQGLRYRLYILLGAVGLLFLIACVNVANLLLARATGRQKEFAIRASLGASRVRLVRQLMIESLLLAISGAVLGCLLAWDVLGGLVAIIPDAYIPSGFTSAVAHNEAVISMNGPVLLFSLSVAVFSALLFGLAPALHAAGAKLQEPLTATSRGAGESRSHGRLRNLLVASEVALSLVLLTGGVLLMRSFFAQQHADLGYKPDNVLPIRSILPEDRYKTAEQRNRFCLESLRRMRALPGVVSAALGGCGYLGGMVWGQNAPIEIAGKSSAEHQEAWQWFVGDRFFETLGIRLLQGRTISEEDYQHARKVAVVNRAFVNRYFAGENPLGRQVLSSSEEYGIKKELFEIIGVVADTRHSDDTELTILPSIFLPYTGTTNVILVRTAADPIRLLNSIRREFAAIDGEVPVEAEKTLRDDLAYMYTEPRFVLTILVAFASLGLMLVTIGVYGVLSYHASQRTREIGIRMALGAQAAEVRWLVLKAGLRSLLLGIGIGVPASIALAKILQNRIWGIKSADPLTLIAVSLLLTAVGLVACYIPARRATKVDPMVALRYE